jgi:transposase
MAGTHGTSRRTLQPFCASVLQVPLRLGAMQKLRDRVAQAIAPHGAAIAQQARHAPVNYLDETPWFLTTTLQGLGVMASATVAFYMIHPRRSKEAFAALIEAFGIAERSTAHDHSPSARQAYGSRGAATQSRGVA